MLTAEFQQTLLVRAVLSDCENGDFSVMTAGMGSGGLNDISIVVVRIRLTLTLFIKISGNDIEIKG